MPQHYDKPKETKKKKKKVSKKAVIKRKSKMNPSQPADPKIPIYSQRENKKKFLLEKIKSIP